MIRLTARPPTPSPRPSAPPARPSEGEGGPSGGGWGRADLSSVHANSPVPAEQEPKDPRKKGGKGGRGGATDAVMPCFYIVPRPSPLLEGVEVEEGAAGPRARMQACVGARIGNRGGKGVRAGWPLAHPWLSVVPPPSPGDALRLLALPLHHRAMRGRTRQDLWNAIPAEVHPVIRSALQRLPKQGARRLIAWQEWRRTVAMHLWDRSLEASP